MSSRGSPPDTATLLRFLTGPPPDHTRFAGGFIDLSGVHPLAIGDVWSVAEEIDDREMYRCERSFVGRTAAAIISRRSHVVPAFRGSACLDYLDRFVSRTEASENRSRYDVSMLEGRVSFALSRCVDLSFGGLRGLAERVLAICPWIEIPYVALVLGRIVGGAVEKQVLDVLTADFARSPLVIDELRMAAALPLREAAILSEMIDTSEWSPPVVETGGSRYRLSGLPEYVEFAHTILRRAVERVAAIHRGDVPYAADKAFTPTEAKVVGRCLRLGLDRDKPWVPPLLESLFPKVSVAPTAAKTMPSQAVAVALGHATEAYPTPEAVVILRQVLRGIRHAGVEKKLQRNLRGAEKGLAGRVEIALRLPPNEPVTKAQLTTLARALEATFGAPQSLTFATWHTRLAEHPAGRDIAASLIWRIVGGSADGAAVLPVAERGRLEFETADGDTVIPETDCDITLWHPADATPEARVRWRDLVVARQIRQPFKQAFREHYAVPDQAADNLTDMFAGHAVSLRPFLGLARREGWRAEGGNAITRRVGSWTVTLVLADEVYPGATGWTTSGNVGIWSSAEPRWVPASFARLPAAVLSEIFRSVDLLVGTSGFATIMEPGPTSEEPLRRAHLEHLGESPLGAMAEMRKRAVERVLSGRPDMSRLEFGPRHLRLGSYAIHLATSRVTRDGDPVTIDLPSRSSIAAVPWLPYDEKLLERIVYTAIEIAALTDSDPR